jgi:4-diphosphocytidyl-2-C-methyl-D-erythritol kinase
MRRRWSGPSLVVETPAKLNLHLDVLGRRSDGYHELETVMVSVGLYDTLRFAPCASGIQFSMAGGSDSADVPADSTNLVVRAARAIQAMSGRDLGVSISLQKRIPSQAGMGGGSSDAAATIVGLNQFWNLNLPGAELHAIAATLGSDVNFFMDSPALAVCRGRGERIEPQRVAAPFWFVIVKPEIGLSTAAVFRQLHSPGASVTNPERLLNALSQGDVGAGGRALHNALEIPARELSLDVNKTLEELNAVQVAGSLMTGSGTACFGMCYDRGHAQRVAAKLRAKTKGSVFVVPMAV